jgi:hypothetical protein
VARTLLAPAPHAISTSGPRGLKVRPRNTLNQLRRHRSWQHDRTHWDSGTHLTRPAEGLDCRPPQAGFVPLTDLRHIRVMYGRTGTPFLKPRCGHGPGRGRLSGTAGGIVRLLGLRSGGGRQAPDRTAPTGGLIGADPPPEGGRTVRFWILDGIGGPPVQQDRLALGEQWARSAQRTPGSRVTINDDRARAVCS